MTDATLNCKGGGAGISLTNPSYIRADNLKVWMKETGSVCFFP